MILLFGKGLRICSGNFFVSLPEHYTVSNDNSYKYQQKLSVIYFADIFDIINTEYVHLLQDLWNEKELMVIADSLAKR